MAICGQESQIGDSRPRSSAFCRSDTMYLWRHHVPSSWHRATNYMPGLCSLNARQKRIRQKLLKWNWPNLVCPITVWCFSQPQVSPHTVTYQRTRRERALLQISSLLSLEITREKERNQKRVKMALECFGCFHSIFLQKKKKKKLHATCVSTTRPAFQKLFCWDPALIDQDHVELV